MNTEFEWTDELVIEYGLQVKSKIDIAKDIEQFKASKTKPKEYEIIERFNYSEVSIDGDIAPIKSVMRLSDNEVFSIGDKCNYGKDGCLTKLHISKAVEMLCDFDFSSTSGYSNVPLRAIEKAKITLFTTEDGVAIKEGDTFFYIGDAFNICETKCLFVGDGDFTKSKTFSTLEKALEYVVYNQPFFSINAIYDAFKDTSIMAVYGDRLIKLAKSKIKTHE